MFLKQLVTGSKSAIDQLVTRIAVDVSRHVCLIPNQYRMQKPFHEIETDHRNGGDDDEHPMFGQCRSDRRRQVLLN